MHSTYLQHSLFDSDKSLSSRRENLIALLSGDLDFHDEASGYASHNFHSFPAKFPPQLPRKFILGLTSIGEVVLDPMMGSGTTVVEAYLSERRAIGFDIDPLAIRLTQSKISPLDAELIEQLGSLILQNATVALDKERNELKESLTERFDPKTKEFVDFWFAHDVQIQLMALLREIEKIEDPRVKAFFELVFSAIIITKSGGVSMALDLAHTRPHRAKIVIDQNNQVILGEEYLNDPSERLSILTKKFRSPLVEFRKKLHINLQGLLSEKSDRYRPYIQHGDSQRLPLEDNCIDLIVTSPPYASNAIDYMRAHKFSLVWFKHSIDELTQIRKEYIGGELTTGMEFQNIPPYTAGVVAEIAKLDKKKALVVHRYYTEMTLALGEMFRVLKPGKAAIVVVGSSVIRGRDTETGKCLADIGQSLGFEVPTIGIRQLDRDRRMLPAGMQRNHDSQIQQRMHEEFVIGFYKSFK